MTEKTKSIILKNTLIMLLLPIASGSGIHHTEQPDSSSGFEDGIISCVIDTGEENSSSRLRAGFNYEMLQKYAAAGNLPTVIKIAEPDADYADSLAAGTIDLLVRSLPDSLDRPDIIKARDTGNDCAWYISRRHANEFKNINIWASAFTESKEYSTLRSRFYSIYDPFRRLEKGLYGKRLSPYDALIIKHAGTIGWDWRMLAAVIYQESRFSITAHSPRGAKGLMQILPNTASYYKIYDIFDPEQNIVAGTRHLARLQKAFPANEFSGNDRIRFTLAAYNAGEGRIADCRYFAASKGLDNTVWDNIIQIIPDMQNYSVMDNDTIKERRFRGGETMNYVKRVLDIYTAFCEICPE